MKVIKIYAQWIDFSGGIDTEFIGRAVTSREIHAIVNRDAEMFYGIYATTEKDGNVYYVLIHGEIDTTVWYLLEEEN